MCCSLNTFGYKTNFQQNLVKTTSIAIALSAIAGVAMGVMALYGALPTSTALWTQVGLFSAGAIMTGVSVATSSRVESKLAVAMAIITLLAMPVLFGSLGALNIIPPFNMLWSSTAMCGAMVLGSFLTSIVGVGQECCNSEN